MSTNYVGSAGTRRGRPAVDIGRGGRAMTIDVREHAGLVWLIAKRYARAAHGAIDIEDLARAHELVVAGQRRPWRARKRRAA